MHYTALENSQSTAIEKIDLQLAEAIDKKEFVAVDVTNDGTNACAFLTIGIIDRLSDVDLKSDFKKEVEETISEFPNLFNPYRNVGSFYDIYKAYDILESHQLLKNKVIFQEDFLNKKNMFTLDSYLCLKNDLVNLLKKSKEGKKTYFAIYQADSYIFSLAVTSDGNIIVFESHPISEECRGNGNGLVVSGNSISQMLEWINLRLVKSGASSNTTPFIVHGTLEAVQITTDEVDSDCYSHAESIDVENPIVHLIDDYDDDSQMDADDFQHLSFSFRNTTPFQPMQKKYSRSLWNDVYIKLVDKVPNDIDGTKIYKVKGEDRSSLLQACQDGRKWKRNLRTEWKGYTSVRYKDCQGLFICPNEICNFVKQFNWPNQIIFSKYGFCEHCGTNGIHLPCQARKYIAYISETEADIYHYGQHNCTEKSTFIRRL